MKRIYFDNNATTCPRPEVIETFNDVMKKFWGNPSSIHADGQDARRIVEESREKIAHLLNAPGGPAGIVFTSSGSESNNTAIKGVAFYARTELLPSGGGHIITTPIEHHAVLNVCEYLRDKHNFEITYLPVDETGLVSPDSVKSAIREDTVLVSVMYANNEIGTIEPVEEIGKVVYNARKERERKGNSLPLYFHIDAVQAAGKIPIDLSKLKTDFLSISAHKFYGPKGVGMLWVRPSITVGGKENPVNFHPLIHGGHHEANRRASTENVPGIAAMAKALELAVNNMEEEEKRILDLRQKLEAGIFSQIPHVRLNGHPTQRIAGTLNVSFDYLEAEGLAVALDMAGISVSTGSACASGSTEPSHVITAIGCPPELARGSVRFSLGIYNTMEEVEKVLKVLPGIVEKLRTISPLYKKNKNFSSD